MNKIIGVVDFWSGIWKKEIKILTQLEIFGGHKSAVEAKTGLGRGTPIGFLLLVLLVAAATAPIVKVFNCWAQLRVLNRRDSNCFWLQ